jgi:hypothetical protein
LNEIQVRAIEDRIQPFTGSVQDSTWKKAHSAGIKPVHKASAHAPPPETVDWSIRKLKYFGFRIGKP